MQVRRVVALVAVEKFDNIALTRTSTSVLYPWTDEDLNLRTASITTDFAESLFSFVTFLESSHAGGSMIVGAGIVPLLVQFLQNQLPSRSRLQVSMLNSSGAAL